MITIDELLKIFEREAAKVGGLTAWGERHGFSAGYLCQIRHRDKPPSKRLTALLGYREVKRKEVSRLYERVEQ